MGAVGIGSELGNGIESDIAFQRTGNPTADAPLPRQINPLQRTRNAPVERRFENDVLRLDGIEQPNFFIPCVHPNEFLIQGDR